MTNEVKNVPELRFPGFEGEWGSSELGNIAENYIGGGTPSTKVKEYWNGNIPWIQSSDLKIDDVKHMEFHKYINSLAIENSSAKLIPKNSIAIVTRVGVGKLALIREEFSTSQDFLSLSNLSLDTNYALYALYKLIRKESTKLQGTSIKGLTKNDLLSKHIKIPSYINEQEQIGDFFSKLDRQIELEEQKLAKLEEQKKGYMQQIFSQQLRFKDENGNDYPGWKEYVLGETGNTYSGLSSKTKEDFGYGDSYFITYMNVFKNTIAKANMTEKVNIQENEKQNKVNYKDILFTTSSEVPEETGMSSIWLYKENNVYLNSFCFGFHVTCDDIEPIYLTRFLRSEKMRKQITILSQGSTRFNISKKEVMKLKIDVPNLEEQTKIVNFLSEYDSLIENQSSKIELLKERKKGFLQKMFV
ncbi:restriction endonuclease subunit S [Staphylococcus nepalensis]|uniref:restriction endonuclease subunit S n=2 Tax=Staphylococcus TaxID=1279 RepID=UPI001E60B8B7|nr:restriction endonuclease subunit S [Staphylococcus nepalensis]MCD8892200.1 restriction endonuclease subunit S [Staphylococcus nepalensis]